MNKIRTGILSAAVLSLLIVFIFLGLYLLGRVDGLVSLIVGVPFGILGAIFTLWWILLVINHPFAENLFALPLIDLSAGQTSASPRTYRLAESLSGQQATKLRVSRLARRRNKLSAKQISEMGGETDDECAKEVQDNRLDQMTQDTQPEEKEEKRMQEAAAVSDSPKADQLPGVEEKIESAQSEATECAISAERKTTSQTDPETGHFDARSVSGQIPEQVNLVRLKDNSGAGLTKCPGELGQAESKPVNQIKRVLITGAAQGIGQACAYRFAQCGYQLVLLDKNRDGLGVTAKQAEEIGAQTVATHVVDLADPAQLSSILQDSGKFTAVVCAAGILIPGGLKDTSLDDWHRHLQVNTTAVFQLLQQVKLFDHAAVVVVSSNAARLPRRNMLAYAASKAATSALTRCIGLELADRGIRCNVIEPGSTDTAMQNDLWADPEKGRKSAILGNPAEYRLGIPLQKIGQPQDVAELAYFLASPAAGHITLQQIFVDGGASI